MTTLTEEQWLRQYEERKSQIITLGDGYIESINQAGQTIKTNLTAQESAALNAIDNKQADAVASIEQKRKETLADIPDDYSQ